MGKSFPRRSYLFALLLVALAVFVNALNVEFVPGVRLFFGSIFILILAAVNGPVWAAIGGFLAGTIPFALWQSPADIAMFTLEGLLVALVYPRLYSLTLAALGYWALIGVPVFILGHLGDMGSVLAWVILLKVGTNGVFNALLADLALLLLAQRFGIVSRPLGGLRLNQVLVGMLLPATLLPATFLTFFHTRAVLKGIEAGIGASLASDANKGALAIESILNRHLKALWGLARAADQGISQTRLIDDAALVQSVFPEFHTLLVIGDDGGVDACLSERLECSKLSKEDSLSRDTRLGLVQKVRTPTLFDRMPLDIPGFEDDPVVVVPRARGRGVVVGGLDLDLLGQALFRVISPGVLVRLVDAKDNTRFGLSPLAVGSLDSGSYERRRLKDGVLFAIPKEGSLKTRSFVERWMGSFYLYRVSVQKTPWTLETRLAFAGTMDRLAMTLMPGLLAFWGLAFILLLLSWVISRTVSRPLNQLKALALRFQERPLDPIPSELWPSTPVREASSLSSSIKALWETLRDSLMALKRSNETLEAKVAKRTEALQDTIERLKAEIERRKGLEDLLERAQRIAHIGSWERDLKTNAMVYSKEIYRIFGFEEGEPPSYERFMAAVHPEDRQMVERSIEKAIKNRSYLDLEYRIVRPNGEVRYVREQAEVVCDEQGVPIKFTGTNQDITEEKRAKMALEESESNLRTLLTSLPLAVGFKDRQGRWLLANPLTLRLFKLEGIDYQGKTDAELAQIVPEIAETLAYCQVTDERTWRAASLCRYEEKLEGHNGQTVLAEVTKVPLFEQDGSPRGLIFVARDIAEERAAQTRIEQLTYYDGLTGLPNRLLLAERLRQALSHHAATVVVLVDLDRFKVLNESLGFEASNEVLKEVALRLKQLLRPQDTLSRPWGDEFCIVMPDIVSAEDVGDIALRILKVFKDPFRVEGKDVFVTASLGLAMAPKDGREADALLKNAEMAMYRAKERGGDTYAFYTMDLDDQVSEYLLLETNLRKALNNGGLSLHYQPQISLDTGGIIGCEALLRWNSDELGTVSPVKFIPVAERSGLILPPREKGPEGGRKAA